MLPTRASLRAFSLASQALLKTISKVAGAEIVNDAVAFFQAFAGMEEGFRLRARRVRDLLETARRAFVLVSAPRLDTVTEAGWFAGRLEEAGLAVDALVVNRVHPVFWKKVDELPDVGPGSNSATSSRTSAICEVNARERVTIAELVEQVAPAPVVRVPLLDADVHDLGGVSCRRRPLRPTTPSTRIAPDPDEVALVTGTAGR